MELDEFLNKKFDTMTAWTPTTGLGCFDVTLDPKKLTLDVEIRAKLTFADSPARKWESDEKKEFAKGLKLVKDTWSGEFKMACKKKGWEKVVLKVGFELVDSGDKPHYEVKVYPTMGTRNTAVRPDGTAMFGIQAVDRLGNAKTQLEQCKRDMKMPLVIPIAAKGGAQFSFQSMDLLLTFVQTSKAAFEDKVGKVTVNITGFGGKDEKENKANAEKVKAILTSSGLSKGKFNVTSGKPTAKDVPECGVEVRYTESELESNFPKTAESALNFCQATIVHEFGHMLGLPDEYNALCSESTETMVGLGILGGTDKQRKSETQARLADVGPTGIEGPKTENIKKNQKRFTELCGEAKVPVPAFGKANPSIMSCGSTFALCHAVTVWEALCEMTDGMVAKNEWEIRK